jgi:hypothetical protein
MTFCEERPTHADEKMMSYAREYLHILVPVGRIDDVRCMIDESSISLDSPRIISGCNEGHADDDHAATGHHDQAWRRECCVESVGSMAFLRNNQPAAPALLLGGIIMILLFIVLPPVCRCCREPACSSRPRTISNSSTSQLAQSIVVRTVLLTISSQEKVNPFRSS